MLIQEMTNQSSLEMLARASMGRVACVHEGQPYVTPMSVTRDGNWLYAFSTVGQKIDWMRTNPRVCVEVDEVVSHKNWATVIVMGEYQELTTDEERAYAHALLQRRPAWWEPGYSKTMINGKERPLKGVFFRIRIDKVTGHIGFPEHDRS